MNRRDFITAVAASAGSVYAAMKALDLLDKPATAQDSPSGRVPFQLQPTNANKRIIILGAGLAGMCSAYELGKVGYECQILEARDRSGGRCWTLRGGDSFTEIDGQTQTAQFDSDLYFNTGPARIPYHHVTIDYCKELGVPLEVFVNVSRQQYYYQEDSGSLSGRKVHAREAITDMRGYVSQLLAKAVDSDAINAPLTAEDKEKLIEFLKTYGGLDPDLFYKGSSRRGYTVPPSAGLQEGEVADPYDLSALIQLGFANYDVAQWDYNQQMTTFQPVGGVDRIAQAFERQVGERITFNAQVKEIRKTPDGVRIVYADKSGNTLEATGDYCICTIPLTVLRNIPSDFSPDMHSAIANVDYYQIGKTGLQFNRRFWEEDEDIFGGITWTNQTINQIWYPSYGYLSNKGILVSGYNYGYEGFDTEEDAIAIGNLPVDERISLVLSQGSKIHPQYNNHFENGVSVFWPKIPYNLGAWSKYTTQTRQQYYPRLNQPDGNIYLAGEHLSYLTGWMAGALESARLVTSKIAALS
jgi:monoamine oxidase